VVAAVIVAFCATMPVVEAALKDIEPAERELPTERSPESEVSPLTFSDVPEIGPPEIEAPLIVPPETVGFETAVPAS